jgi:hypothetical protein
MASKRFFSFFIFSVFFLLKAHAQSDAERILDSIETELQNLNKISLLKEDSNYLTRMRGALNKNDSIKYAILDTLIQKLKQNDTPWVLAVEITNIIAADNTYYSTKLLLDNIQIKKDDTRRATPWEVTRFPCVESLIEKGNLMIAYDIILNSKFLDSFHIRDIYLIKNKEWPIKSYYLLKRLFDARSFSDALILYTIDRTSIENTKKQEMLKVMLE